jgi:uncharacterized protein YggU (UPF0235/DUF167 family)
MFVRVTVKAGSKKESVTKKVNGVFTISVREDAVRNEANERVRKIVARLMAVPLKEVVLVSGHHRPNKRFQVGKDT